MKAFAGVPLLAGVWWFFFQRLTPHGRIRDPMRHIPGALGLRGQTPEQDKKNESTM